MVVVKVHIARCKMLGSGIVTNHVQNYPKNAELTRATTASFRSHCIYSTVLLLDVPKRLLPHAASVIPQTGAMILFRNDKPASGAFKAWPGRGPTTATIKLSSLPPSTLRCIVLIAREALPDWCVYLRYCWSEVRASAIACAHFTTFSRHRPTCSSTVILSSSSSTCPWRANLLEAARGTVIDCTFSSA
jgi:hypothetical protein